MESLLDLDDRYVEVNTIKTRFRHAGNSGPVVVLVHGLGGYVECWTPLFDALSVNHRVYAFDLVGFGKTDKPDGSYNYLFFADFLPAFCDSLSIAKANIIGWSLGGGTALQFTIKHPEIVEKLVVIGSGGLSNKLGIVLRILTVPLLGKWLSKPSLAASKNNMAYMVYDSRKIQPEWITHDCTINMIPGVQSTILRTLRSGATIFGGKKSVGDPIQNNLDSINAQTLVIWGKQDKIVPCEAADVAARRIPNCELFLLDECGHCPHLEYPEEVAKRVLEFFSAS